MSDVCETCGGEGTTNLEVNTDGSPAHDCVDCDGTGFKPVEDDHDICYQESCINCGDPARGPMSNDDLKWDEHGDALCSECGHSRCACGYVIKGAVPLDKPVDDAAERVWEKFKAVYPIKDSPTFNLSHSDETLFKGAFRLGKEAAESAAAEKIAALEAELAEARAYSERFESALLKVRRALTGDIHGHDHIVEVAQEAKEHAECWRLWKALVSKCIVRSHDGGMLLAIAVDPDTTHHYHGDTPEAAVRAATKALGIE